MTHALYLDKAWTEARPDRPLINADSIAVSWETFQSWPEEERTAFGARVVPEPGAPPEGKVETSRTLGGPKSGPKWIVTYGDVPEPGPEPVPASVTNSDWRVGLILWGRFAEVEAKVTAERDKGTTQGLIVWQRWEYANEVFRTELLALHDTFGFSIEEVDESLTRARAVSQGALAA